MTSFLFICFVFKISINASIQNALGPQTIQGIQYATGSMLNTETFFGEDLRTTDKSRTPTPQFLSPQSFIDTVPRVFDFFDLEGRSHHLNRPINDSGPTYLYNTPNFQGFSNVNKDGVQLERSNNVPQTISQSATTTLPREFHESQRVADINDPQNSYSNSKIATESVKQTLINGQQNANILINGQQNANILINGQQNANILIHRQQNANVGDFHTGQSNMDSGSLNLCTAIASSQFFHLGHTSANIYHPYSVYNNTTQQYTHSSHKIGYPTYTPQAESHTRTNNLSEYQNNSQPNLNGIGCMHSTNNYHSLPEYQSNFYLQELFEYQKTKRRRMEADQCNANEYYSNGSHLQQQSDTNHTESQINTPLTPENVPLLGKIISYDESLSDTEEIDVVNFDQQDIQLETRKKQVKFINQVTKPMSKIFKDKCTQTEEKFVTRTSENQLLPTDNVTIAEIQQFKTTSKSGINSYITISPTKDCLDSAETSSKNKALHKTDFCQDNIDYNSTDKHADPPKSTSNDKNQILLAVFRSTSFKESLSTDYVNNPEEFDTANKMNRQGMAISPLKLDCEKEYKETIENFKNFITLITQKCIPEIEKIKIYDNKTFACYEITLKSINDCLWGAFKLKTDDFYLWGHKFKSLYTFTKKFAAQKFIRFDLDLKKVKEFLLKNYKKDITCESYIISFDEIIFEDLKTIPENSRLMAIKVMLDVKFQDIIRMIDELLAVCKKFTIAEEIVSHASFSYLKNSESVLHILSTLEGKYELLELKRIGVEYIAQLEMMISRLRLITIETEFLTLQNIAKNSLEIMNATLKSYFMHLKNKRTMLTCNQVEGIFIHKLIHELLNTAVESFKVELERQIKNN